MSYPAFYIGILVLSNYFSDFAIFLDFFTDSIAICYNTCVMGKYFDISIIRESTESEIITMGYSGLCMKRFHADITMPEVQFNSLKIHDIIMVNGRKLRIEQIGKRCFDGCQLLLNNTYCPLKSGCAFGMWVD